MRTNSRQVLHKYTHALLSVKGFEQDLTILYIYTLHNVSVMTGLKVLYKCIGRVQTVW